MARTKPITVRFDEDKLEFIKSREKLESNQQIVDLLVNKYWWEFKLPVPTAKEAPPLELRNSIAPVVEKIIKPKSLNDWITEKRELCSEDDYSFFLNDLEKDEGLSEKQKNLIKIS